MSDVSFKIESRYGSTKWVAAALGKTVDWFRSNKSKLEGDGFPQVDPIIKAWIKADVDAWVNARRRISDRVTQETSITFEGFNEDEL